MTMTSLHGTPDDSGNLTWILTEQDLGFAPAAIWNSSPSITNFTGFHDLPHEVILGTTFEIQESASRFSPPPLAVAVSNAAGDRRMLLAITADAGHHRFATVVFNAIPGQVTVTVELEGHSIPAAESPFIRLELTPARPAESNLQLLARGLHAAYPKASQPRAQADWWRLPIFCAGGSAGAMAFHLFGPGAEARCMPFASEWMTQRCLDILKDADVPVGSVIIDCGWSPGGVWSPYPSQWPDMKAFIARQHKAGIRVLLWLGTWFTEGLPDNWCMMAQPGTAAHFWNPMTNSDTFEDLKAPARLWADASNPEYLDFVARQVRTLLSPEGLDADGFKIDMLQMTPCERFAQGREHWNRPVTVLDKPHPPVQGHGSSWGIELLYSLQKTIYDAAKSVKPDALINSSTVHPYFHDTFDMMRLHDTCRIEKDTDVFAVMSERAALARAALPAHAIDTDNWIHTYYDKWLDYTLNSYKLGTPCLFFTEHFVRSFTQSPSTQPVPREDLVRLGRNWRNVLGL